MLYTTKDYGANQIEYVEIETVTVPVIQSSDKDKATLSKLQSLLIDGVFSKGEKGYQSNENHLLFFNGYRFVAWINSKGFIHMVLVESKYGEHYRLHKTKNTLEPVNESGYYDSKKLISNSVNVIAKKNIYI